MVLVLVLVLVPLFLLFHHGHLYHHVPDLLYLDPCLEFLVHSDLHLAKYYHLNLTEPMQGLVLELEKEQEQKNLMGVSESWWNLPTLKRELEQHHHHGILRCCAFLWVLEDIVFVDSLLHMLLGLPLDMIVVSGPDTALDTIPGLDLDFGLDLILDLDLDPGLDTILVLVLVLVLDMIPGLDIVLDVDTVLDTILDFDTGPDLVQRLDRRELGLD